MISLIKRNSCGKALDIARMARDMLGGKFALVWNLFCIIIYWVVNKTKYPSRKFCKWNSKHAVARILKHSLTVYTVNCNTIFNGSENAFKFNWPFPSLEHFTNDFQETKTQVIRSVSSIRAKATIKKITQWGSSAGKWRRWRQVRA